MDDHDFFLSRSRQLRRDQTPAEQILWGRLRNRRLDGIKVRRQHVLGRFIVDFFVPEYGLVIELDGVSHVTKREADRIRDEDITALGLAVLRVWNNAVYDDLECVLDAIWRHCAAIRNARPSREPQQIHRNR
jgi:very-short-patch-repair endonuclease